MPPLTKLIRLAVLAATLLCLPCQAGFFSSCQRAIRSFLPWVGISTEGLRFHWIENEAASDLLRSLEADTKKAMAAGLAPSDAFQYAQQLSRLWLSDNPVEPGTAIFAAPRRHEWVVAITSHTYACLYRNPERTFDLTPSLRDELTPRMADHFRRGPSSPGYANGRAETLLGKYRKHRRTYYTTLDHLPIAAAIELSSCNGYNPHADPLHHLLLTSPQNISSILADVSRRLETLREVPRTAENLDERLRVFTAAVYGYYQAFPYERGTHSIGQALFRGFFWSLFGHDLNQWPSEDRVLDFLVVSQARFVELMMPFFKGSLIGPHP